MMSPVDVIVRKRKVVRQSQPGKRTRSRPVRKVIARILAFVRTLFSFSIRQKFRVKKEKNC